VNLAGRRAATAFVTVLGVLFLVPFVWLVVTAFQAHGTLDLSGGGGFTLGNFSAVLGSRDFTSGLENSLYLATGTTILTTVIGILAAYPLSRFRSRSQEYFIYAIIFLTGLPIIALMIPTYDIFVSANIIDSKFWTVWFLTATSLPFATWIGRSFIDAVPRELEEASWLDGLGLWGSLRRIVIPLIGPGIGVIAVYTFVNAWANFFVPFVLLQDRDQPAAVKLYSYFGQYDVNYSQVAAFAILFAAPPVILYLVVTKWVSRGFALGGALKG
jgi:multiple sugar transport system permease protein